MKNIHRYPLLAILCLISVIYCACDDQDVPSTPNTDPKTTEEWITDFLKTEYLWNDEVKEKTPDMSSPDKLFYSLLSLKDGKTRNGSHYYSYIEQNGITKSISEESTYGFEFVLYKIVDKNDKPLDYYYARILYVLPGSPAESAGLKRGDWITKIAKKTITDRNELMSGPATSFGLQVSSPFGNKEKEIAIGASVAIDENPLLLDTVLNVNNTKVGYLVYNHFKAGKSNDSKDSSYDNEMISIFKKFEKENVTEFVLDLRYNGGGYLSCAQLLSGFFVSEESKNDIFCYLEDNNRNMSAYKFSNKNCHLGLSRLFILTSSQTASASEAVINGLKPYMNVILIGETTEGKNVGSVHEEYGEWAIQPIVSRIYNKLKKSDYENGFTPDQQFICNELKDKSSSLLYPLGDQREYLLAKALAVIKGSKVSSAPATRSTTESGIMPAYNSVERKQTNAVLIR